MKSRPKKKLVQFNINDNVRVKLTPHGRSILAQNHAKMLEQYPSLRHEYHPPKEDDYGWSEWQMWELMNTFGQRLYNGCKAPFETDIEIVFP